MINISVSPTEKKLYLIMIMTTSTVSTVSPRLESNLTFFNLL